MVNARRRLIVAVVLATVVAVVDSPPAGAALPPAVPTPGLVTNGTVKQILHVGSITYLGGTFGRVGQPTSGLAAVDPSSGAQAGTLPSVTGTVDAVASDGAGGIYVGGKFTSIGGIARADLAHVLADGTVDPAFAPVVNDEVTQVARADDGTVFIAGAFTRVDGARRVALAAVTPAGQVTPFDAGFSYSTDGNTSVDVIAAGAGVLYVVGEFAQIGGRKQPGVAALDATTGLATDWADKLTLDEGVDAVAVDGTTVFLAGDFTKVDGQRRNGVAALDAAGNVLPWAPDHAPDDNVNTIAVGGGLVYVASSSLQAYDETTGHQRWDRDTDDDRNIFSVLYAAGGVYFGGDLIGIAGHSRGFAAAVSAAGQVLPWDPRANNDVTSLAAVGDHIVVGGEFTSTQTVARAHLAAVDASGRLTAWNPDLQTSDLPRFAVETLAAGPGRIYVGGSFDRLGGARRTDVGAVSTAGSGRAVAWNPRVDNQVDGIAVHGSTVYLGGFFAKVGRRRRRDLAAVRASNAAVLPWNPGLDTGGDDFAGPLVSDGSTLYIAGQFRTIGGKPRESLAAVTTGGRVLPWNPGADSEVDALVISGHDAYVGGYFDHVGDARRPHVAKVSLAGRGAVEAWHAKALGDDTVPAILATADAVYVAGTADSNSDGPSGSGAHLVAVSPTTGARLAWAPHPSAGVTALAQIGGRLWVGGGFRAIGGLPLSGLAIF